ncbi:MAG TPA: hypothetical protein ENF48_05045 [Desulfobacteraceae bacterium]|nr:hypothetical protein [Deltaproteobacteria bacterium]MBW2355784.1 hypothetical protein [Deltaproteobacteria bacterium]HDI59714.1 hypothetical protein [Desulfobacteraceae bacterium]
MPESHQLTEFFQTHKTLMVLVTVGLLLVEIEIFALAAMKSGRQARLEVYNPQGHLIYETDGSNLSQFNRYYFEKTFGPLDQYEVRLSRHDRPFPFRAWFVAAVGVPVGTVLLFAFVVRAFQGLFQGSRRPRDVRQADDDRADDNRLVRLFGQFSRLNVFALGALVLAAVLAYWIVPNLVVYLGQVGLETLLRFKWFFITVGLIGVGLVVWIIYLRYRLACKSIESREQVEKYRLQLECGLRPESPKLLECCDVGPNQTPSPSSPRKDG